MKLMIEACTKKARTGSRRRTWWGAPEGEFSLSSIEYAGTRKISETKKSSVEGNGIVHSGDDMSGEL